MSTKQVVSDKKGQAKRPKTRPRLVYTEPHVFHLKNNRSLSHLQESREYLPCVACSKEADRRQETSVRPHSSYNRQRSTPPPISEQRPSTATKKKSSPSPPTPEDLERLSRPKTVPPEQISNNCNWNNFIKKKSKYAIKTPHALCDLTYNQEHSETRPPFINYGGRYDDKQYGEKRTFNSLAIHQLKHHEVEEQRLAEVLRERRLRLQAENYFREMEEHFRYISKASFYQVCRHICPENVISLILSNGNETVGQIGLFLSIFDRDLFIRLSSLTLIRVNESELKILLNHIIKCPIVLLSIEYQDEQKLSIATIDLLSSTIEKLTNLRKFKFIIKHLPNKNIQWPENCPIQHLTLNCYTPFQLLTTLQDLPHLQTLALHDLDMTEIFIPSSCNIISSLKSLSMKQSLIHIDKI